MILHSNVAYYTLTVSILLGACWDCHSFSERAIATGPSRPRRRRSGHRVLLASASSSEAGGQRRPWEFFRFVRQSSRFVDVLPRKVSKRSVRPGDVLWKPVDVRKDFDFAPLDDVVMGGASSSTFDGNTGKWTGRVTDANSGGFIGIRSTPVVDLDMSGCEGIEVKLSSSPRPRTLSSSSSLRLKLVVRDSTEFNGVAWTTSKAASGRSIRVPFDRQVPTIFAKTVESEPFRKDQVKSIQLVYSKFEYDGALNPTFATGDFALQVEEVRAY